jgi:hypothetical protein
MKIDKAEKILQNFIGQRECPANVKEALETYIAHELWEFHRLNFAQCYLTNVTELSKDDVEVLRQGIH